MKTGAVSRKDNNKTGHRNNKLLVPHLQQNDSFLRVMQSVFSAARYFGVPTTGGRLCVFWFTILLLLHIFLECGTVYKVIKMLGGWTQYTSGNRSAVARFSGAIFYGNAVCSLIIFWKLRSAWKRIANEWCLAENITGIHFSPDKHLDKKLKIVIIVVIICSVLEHTMSMVSTTGFDFPIEQFLRHYILNSHAFLIIPSDYSVPLGVTIFILSKTATLLWNFQDMVIILFSVGLTSRYNRLNKYVEQEIKLALSSSYKENFDDYMKIQIWRKIREAYVRQAALVRKVDTELGTLILLSNSNNFYFICLQIFNGVGGQEVQIINKVYFYISTAWLCVRACCVMLAAADVNVHSKRALKFIHACPEQWYNIEVQRLEKQLSRDFVALSGMGFFYLDRQLLLEVAAAIFKYELVLLEFDG